MSFLKPWNFLTPSGIGLWIGSKIARTHKSNNKKGTVIKMESKMRFTILGMTGSGKTCYLLGMYDRMSAGVQGFTVTCSDSNVHAVLKGYFNKMYDDAQKGQDRFPSQTDKTEPYTFALQYSYRPIMQFEWLDYPGGLIGSRDGGNKGDPEVYQQLIDSISTSSGLFICVDGKLLKGSEDERTKIRNVERNCSSEINFFISEYVRTHGFLPPTHLIVTKTDLWIHELSLEGAEKILRTAFSPFFIGNNIVSIIPVSLGKDIAQDGNKGLLDPVDVDLPIMLGMDFQIVKDKAIYDKALRIYQEENKKWFPNRDRYNTSAKIINEMAEKYGVSSMDELAKLMEHLEEFRYAMYERRLAQKQIPIFIGGESVTLHKAEKEICRRAEEGIHLS